MKLTAILILGTVLHVSAITYSQKVSIKGKDLSLPQIFKSLRNQTGYQFVYMQEIINASKPVTLNVVNVELKDVLDECLNKQRLAYEITDKIITVKFSDDLNEKQGKHYFFVSATPPITGTVRDRDGTPLAGINIIIKGTKKGVITDVKGQFSIEADLRDHLLVSSAGYETKEIVVGNDPQLNISLNKNLSPLDEVQIIAYGTQTQRFSTGNVSSISGKDIQKQPVSNPLQALEGRVPGLVVNQSTGFSGTGMQVSVQGLNSIANFSDPFYVVDGVPYPTPLPRTLGTVAGSSGSAEGVPSGGISALNFINPSDIESVSVLKDAEATAIYGSRAANGAIIITTKKGKAGRTKFDINLQNGWGHVTRQLKLLNTRQYLAMRHEAFKTDSIASPSSADYDLNGTWDTTRYTDWQKELIGGTAKYQNYDASVSGGNENMQYLVGGTYHRETTVLPTDLADIKGAFHFSITSTSQNKKFHLQLTGNYMVDDNRLPGVDLTSLSTILSPNAPSLYNPDGSINWALNAGGNQTWPSTGQPIASLTKTYNGKTNNLVGNISLGYDILQDLSVKVNAGYTNLQIAELSKVPMSSVQPSQRRFSQRFAEFGNTNVHSWIIEPQIIYSHDFSFGKINALIGSTINQRNSNSMSVYAYGFNSDAVMDDIRSATSLSPDNSVVAVYKYNAAFAKLNYNYRDRYLVDVSIRRDGSSRFGSANRFHNFGAIGAGWIFSQENFIKEAFPFLTFGKLRASYGITGNDQIGDYRFLELFDPVSPPVPYQSATGLKPRSLPNPYLQWEETRKANFGIDLGMLNERIVINANYFINRSSNQLISRALPSITGFTIIDANFNAIVRNSGLELAVNTVNIKKKNFEWTSYINLTVPDNKLISYPGLATSVDRLRLKVGAPITVFSAYHFLGVDPQTGVYQFLDGKGKPTFTPSFLTDKNIYMNTAQRFYGGMGNTISYKGLSLDLYFHFVKQLGPGYGFGRYPGYSFNQPLAVLDRWQKPGDQAAVQRYNADLSLVQAYNYLGSSDANYVDASYIRLKNASLSWQLPAQWCANAHLQNTRIYIQGQNLLTITHFNGRDPETRNTNVLPPLRVITVGLQIGL